jgi:hypothetical protein
MRPLTIIGVLLFVPLCAQAQGGKACENLKTEIAAKLDAKGVKSYSLDIVAKDKDTEAKIVGTCEGGTKKIVYSRASTPTQAPGPEATKP